MYRKTISFLLFVSLTCLALCLIGCDDEDCGAISPELSGWITISVVPDSLPVPWLLSGPREFGVSGVGCSELRRLPYGEYTITWEDLEDWQSIGPAISTQDLPPSETIEFSRLYLYNPDPEQAGNVSITISPENLDAPWRLELPDGYWLNDTGERLIEGVPFGEYELIWEDIAGWSAPAIVTEQKLLSEIGQTISFAGTYTRLGTIEVAVDPDQLNAPWRLEGLSGLTYQAFGYGDSTMTGCMPGSYRVTWLPVHGWDHPDPVEAVLEPGDTRSFAGTYVETPPGGFISIEVQPAGIHAPWSLSGPACAAGSGSLFLSDMPLGEYTISWQSGDTHGPPMPVFETRTVLEGQITTFAKTYLPFPPTDWIGVYADPEGTVTEVSIAAEEWVTLYVIAHIPSYESVSEIVFRISNWIGNPGPPAGYAFYEWEATSVLGNLSSGLQLLWMDDFASPESDDDLLLGTITLYSQTGFWPPLNTVCPVIGSPGLRTGVGGEYHSLPGDTLTINPDALGR